VDEESLKLINGLLEGVSRGDERSLTLLYEKTSARLFYIALGITKNRASAEDVLQESFIRVVKHAASFKKKDNGYGWLCTVVRNAALSYIKKQRPEEDIDEFYSLQDERESPQKNETRIEVQEALSKLEKSERRLVWLKYFGDYTLREIAVIEGIPKSTAAYNLQRAEEKLKKFLS
jgi:RNA polymerase sigma-70 factor (ECF subfamily)